jgi:hypothetical protein
MHGQQRGTNCFYLIRVFFLCVLCDFVVSSSCAATPRDELLRLVPDSVGFCIVIQDLRGHAAALQASPFVEQLSASSLGDKVRNNGDLKKLDRIEAEMKEKIGLDWTRLRNDLLGDGLVLAYRPGPPGKPEQEQGAMLLRARNDKVLADLIERVNKVQKDEGELKDLEERRHHDVVYYRRLEVDKRSQRDKPPIFYHVHGPILALSSQEDMLRQIIDCERTRSAEDVPEAARRLHELDAERAVVAVWINPRAFDAEVEAKVATIPSERSAPVKHFARYWKALDSLVLSLALVEREINLSVGVRARVAELPLAGQRLFREGAMPSEVWRRVPESALFAAGGRLDGAALLDVLGGFLSPEHRQALHAALNRQLAALLGEEDFARDILPGLGPDWGLCVTAPAPDDRSWMPQTLLALRVNAKQTKKALDRKLLSAVDFAARLVIFAHNGQHPDQPMTLKTSEVDAQEARYLTSERGLPPGLQPAYGVFHGYLVLASSLDGLTRFTQATPAPIAAPGSPFPLLRISIKDWRAYLRERREAIVQFLASHNNASRDDAIQQLDGLLAGLQLLERIELRQRSTAGKVVFTLSVRTTHALKK